LTSGGNSSNDYSENQLTKFVQLGGLGERCKFGIYGVALGI